jgi:uncharacterized membrane protein YfcA
MTPMIIVGSLIFIVAVLMTMVGKGGGNFYVVILAMANIPMHQAATTGQFILFSASIAAMIVFQKNKSVSWTLAILIGTISALSALGGGYFSHLFSGFVLKILFAVMLCIAGAVMLIPILDKSDRLSQKKHFGMMNFHSGGRQHRVNLWIAVPVTIVGGVCSGIV